jgi:ATP phosphoribosyltransferase regulatory subunit
MTLDTFLTSRTDARPSIDILQPADPFLEAAGESLRRRIFITESTGAGPLCLRPEFTIPLCLARKGEKAGRFAYRGTVFRQGRGEFQQAGLEDLGHAASAERDAQAVRDMAGALAACGLTDITITLGDQAIFERVVAALSLPDGIAARLSRAFGDDASVATQIKALTKPRATGSTEADRLAQAGDAAALEAHIAALMEQAGLPPTAGRRAADIAARAIARAQEAQFTLTAQQGETLRAFLALDTPLSEAGDALAQFADQGGLALGDTLNQFRERASALDGLTVRYRASFGRKLEYYTGVVFEAEAGGQTVAGGGRYDRLCTLLGYDEPTPAVGFSLDLERAEKAGGTP